MVRCPVVHYISAKLHALRNVFKSMLQPLLWLATSGPPIGPPHSPAPDHQFLVFDSACDAHIFLLETIHGYATPTGSQFIHVHS